MAVKLISMYRQDAAQNDSFMSDKQLAAKEALAKRLAASKASPNSNYLHHAAAAVDKFAAMRKRQQIEQERLRRQGASQETFGGLLSGLFKGGDKGVDVASADPAVTPPPVTPQKIMSPPPQMDAGKIPDIGPEVGRQEIAPQNNIDPSNIKIDMVKPKRDLAPPLNTTAKEQPPINSAKPLSPPKIDAAQMSPEDIAIMKQKMEVDHILGGYRPKHSQQQVKSPSVTQEPQILEQQSVGTAIERHPQANVKQLPLNPLEQLNPVMQKKSQEGGFSELQGVEEAIGRVEAGSTFQGTDKNGFIDQSDPRFGAKEVEVLRPEIKTASLGRGNYFENLSQRESGGRDHVKAPSSSATGRYQFIDQTWLGMMKDHGAEAGYPELANGIKKTKSGKYIANPKLKRQILDLRKDRGTSDFMASKFTDKNAEYLKKRGLPDTQTNLYMVHHFGGRGANLAKGNDKAHVSKYLSRSQLKANPYLRKMTVGQLKKNITKSFPEDPGSKGVQVAQNSPFTQEQLMQMYKNPETRGLAQQLAMDMYKQRMKANQPPDPKLQADIANTDSRTELNRLKAQKLESEMQNPQAKSFNPSEMKHLYAAEDEAVRIEDTIRQLQRANEILPLTNTGIAPEFRATLGNILPDNYIISPESSKATTEYSQIMNLQALEAMSRTLKGATTDTEMRKFQEIISDTTLPHKVREDALNRLMVGAQALLRQKRSRIDEIRGVTPQAQEQQKAEDPLGIR